MSFQEWYDNLGESIPHGHVAQMKMAWNAAVDACAKACETTPVHADMAMPARQEARSDCAFNVRALAASAPQAGRE